MTVRNPNLDEEIITYDKLQTSAINDNNEEIKTEISTIKQSILTILSKLDLISDWVIESGSNDNGNWEKWNSGKLVQKGNFKTTANTYTKGEGNIFYSPIYTTKTPIKSLSKDSVYYINAQTNGQQYRSPWLAMMSIISAEEIGFSISQNIDNGISYTIYWELESRWK